MRRFLSELGLAVLLACSTALIAYLLGVQAPGDLVIGGVAGFLLFVFARWWEHIAEPVVGSFSGPIKITLPSYQGPDWAGKKKLRQDTLALVQEMRNWGMAQPDTATAFLAEERAYRAAVAAAKDENEETDLFYQRNIAHTQRSSQERGEIEARFGGRLDYFIGEYMRRKLLTAEQGSLMKWRSRILSFLPGVGSELEALAQQL